MSHPVCEVIAARRGMVLTAITAALAISAIGFASAQGSLPKGSQPADEMTMTFHNPLESEGLTVLRYESPEFMPTLKAMLSPEAITAGEPLLPRAVILVNNTGRYIWGFTVIYTYPEKIAPSGSPWRNQISPSPGWAGDRSRFFAPGAKYLMTPVGEFAAEMEADGRRRLQPPLDDLDVLDRLMATEAGIHDPQRRTFDLSIDSIIYEDGILVGPDRANRMDDVNQVIGKEREFVETVQPLRGHDLEAKLAGYAANQNTRGDLRVSGLAQTMLDDLKNQGEDHLRVKMNSMHSVVWFQGAGQVRRR